MALNLALISLPASLTDQSLNIHNMKKACAQASKGGAQLAVFPELSVTGYENTKAAYERALTQKEMAEICLPIAKKHELAVMAGFVEKKEKKVYLSHMLARKDGRFGVYRKTHLAPPEKPLFNPGDTLPLFELHGFKIGILLCYDAHFPLAFHHMAQHGADLIVIPHASPRGESKEKMASWMRHLPARAFDNSLWVAAVNPSGTNEAGLSFAPLTLLVNPSGHLEGEPSTSRGVQIVSVTQKALTDVRSHRMRYFLPNTRDDIVLPAEHQKIFR
ncbi:MAG: nitrilase [Desulfobacterales bacterium]|nr:nitrilase [Desulfobacterales bacterium]